MFKAMEQWEAVEEWNYLFGNELDALALFSPSDVVPYVNGVMAGNEHVDVGFGFNEILTSWLYGMQCIQ